MPAYDPKAIANFFIEKSRDENKPITPLKLQKLLYFAHGWSLALRNEELVEESIQAWKYGPVIPSIYHEFKNFGNEPILAKAVVYSFDGDTITTETPAISEGDEPTIALLSKVWDVYKPFTALDLSNVTHQTDGPWAKAVEAFQGNPPTSVEISNDAMKEYFVGKIKRNK